MQQDIFNIGPIEGKSFIYRSSAGSGKTFTLAKAFLKLVLRDPSRYNKILAITFTNKAKDEMKSRIISYLSSLAADEESDMRTAILEDFNSEGVERIEDVITSRAQLVLSNLLHDYSRFHVSTIDHFFTRLIRHLARELKLNLGYELDVDNTTALAESVDLLFKTADKNLLKWLNEFALEQIENQKSWDIRGNISDLGRKLFQESYLDIEESLRNNVQALPEFISSNKKIIKDFKTALTDAAKRGATAARESGLVQADFNRKMPLNYMDKVVAGEQDLLKPPSETFLNASTLDTWHTKTSTKVDQIQAARKAGMEKAHSDIVELYQGDSFKQYKESIAILRFIHSYGVLSSLAGCVQQYRSENNLMFISDSAFVLNDVITESETPFIYEKMGSEIGYILIDEFQDTSAYQWKSLVPFFKSVVADGGQVYVVGDVKQSIYGWRGGDMNLLLHQVEEDLNVDDSGIIKLNKNFRSAENIIRFNNEFFKIAASILPISHGLEMFENEFLLAYNEVDQKTSKNYPGLVDIQFIEDEKDHKWTDQSHELVEKKILEALADGFNKNDILLLTRKTAEATQIANYLLGQGIPAISEAALRITSSSKVQLLVAALKYLESQDNRIAIAEFNHFLAEVKGNKTDSYIEVQKVLQELVLIRSKPVYEAVEELILELGLGDRADIYLLKFTDIVLQQTRRGNSTIASFLEWWEEQEDRDSKDFSLSVPDTEDAVMVLTTHKAKGLEKPVVIIPYADDEMRPKSDIFWAKPLPEKYESWGSLPLNFSRMIAETDFNEAYLKQYFDTLLESLNLLYVAFTRAGERLYINSKLNGTASKSAELIYKVLGNPEFNFQNQFDSATSHFILGERNPRQSESKVSQVETETRELNSSQIIENLVIDKKQSELFLEIAGEKSDKVREGIILHKILSVLTSYEALGTTIKQLEAEGFIDSSMISSLTSKVKSLFSRIPEMNKWFTEDYEVINERQIFFNKATHIPDRVMIKDSAAIIVDYKREVENDRHHAQLRRYRDIMNKMGYKNIEMYLLYIDAPTLVKVSG